MKTWKWDRANWLVDCQMKMCSAIWLQARLMKKFNKQNQSYKKRMNPCHSNNHRLKMTISQLKVKLMKVSKCCVRSMRLQLFSFLSSKVAISASSAWYPQASCFISIRATKKKWRILKELEILQPSLLTRILRIVLSLKNGKWGSEED